MEFDTAVRRAFCCENSEEKKAVIPVECSIILPDYFPDVMKILRYTAKTVKAPVYSGEKGETVSAGELVPNYLRLAQAEREKLQKEGKL